MKSLRLFPTFSEYLVESNTTGVTDGLWLMESFYKESQKFLLFCYWANWKSQAVSFRDWVSHNTPIDVEMVRVTGWAETLRPQPVVADISSLVEVWPFVEPSSWKEDTTTILACEFVTINTVYRDPVIGAFALQLKTLLCCRHLPWTTPFYMGNVVLSASDRGTDIMAGFFRTVTVDVVGPVVCWFLLCLAPGIIATKGLWLVRSYIAASPLCTWWQPKVDKVRMVIVGTI